ncbi:MAG: flavin reductase family protein [Actinobacteria bacterium]|nr:MAG: flavin reductase family protein [Actinomycetota bacterium]
MGHFATGVAVVTGLGPDGAVGMTTNALCSVSLDPLLVLVCFDNTARTLPVVQASGRFGVNVLGARQHDLSGQFASKLTIGLGEVLAMGHADGEPLVWYRGAYTSVAGVGR